MFLDTTTAPDLAWLEYVKPFIEALIPIAVTALIVFLGKFLPGLYQLFEKKTSIEISEKKQRAITAALLSGIALWEKKALNAIKASEDAPDSAEKLRGAVEFAKEALGNPKIPDEVLEDWAEIILAQLESAPKETAYDKNGNLVDLSKKHALIDNLTVLDSDGLFPIN